MLDNLSSPSEYPPANIMLRSIAFLLDMFLIIFITLTILGALYPEGMEVFKNHSQQISNSNSETPDFETITNNLEKLAEDNPQFYNLMMMSQPLTFFLLLIYFTLSEVLLGGSTLGKKIFNLRTAYRDSPRIPPLGQLFVRSSVKTIAALSLGHPVLFILVGNFMIAFFRKDRRAGHDLLTRTSVVPGFLPEFEESRPDTFQ